MLVAPSSADEGGRLAHTLQADETWRGRDDDEGSAET